MIGDAGNVALKRLTTVPRVPPRPGQAETATHAELATLPDILTEGHVEPTPSGRRLKTAVILLALGGGIALARLHTYDEPVERDLATYAVVANELLNGQRLYSEIWDNRTPAIHLSYALAQLLVGNGQAQFYLLGVAAAVITLLGVYWAASKGGLRPELGLWAAAFWAAVQSTLGVQANQPNTEVFMNACTIWAFALLVARNDQAPGWPRTLAIGGLLALATLYKHIVIVPAVLLAAAHVAWPPDGKPGRRRALGQALVMAALGAAVWGGLFAYFGATQRLQSFYEAVFVFNRYDIAETLGGGFLEPDTYSQSLSLAGLTLPLSVLAAAGLMVSLARQWTRPGVLLFAYAAATFICICLPHRTYPHYYQLWLPVLAVAAAWVLGALLNPVLHPRRFPATAATALLILLCLRVPDYFQLNGGTVSPRGPEACSRMKYGTSIFVNARRAAQDIDRLLLPGETFYQWGFDPEQYFYSGRRPASGVLWAWSALYTPLWKQQAERILTDLKREPPELVVVVLEDMPSPEWHPVVQWFSTHYRPMGNDEAKYPFRFLCLKGGRLEARQRSQQVPTLAD